MCRKAVSGIVLTLLLMGMLTLAFNIQPAKASGTIYIRTDNSIDSPTAPIKNNVADAFSEPPPTEWEKTYDGPGYDDDVAYSMVQTSDGGYALAGDSWIPTLWHDFWLVKTDSYGDVEWSQTYGGERCDSAYSMVQTSDGGYALAGLRERAFLNYDFWLVKTDSAGRTQWSRTYWGPYEDVANSVVQTVDGGYAIAGWTISFGAGRPDIWLVKTDSAGMMQWNKTYGGTRWDDAKSVVQTGDGGYALAGTTLSFGTGSWDFWLVKTDSAGNVEWNQTYGEASYDYGRSVVQTSDGGYAIAGSGFANLVKTDSAGNMQWNKTYGGTGGYSADSVVQTSDGGYAIAGSGFANLVKTDANGNQQWNKDYGGTAHSVVETVDGGYALAGTKNDDFWLVKLGPPSPHDIAITDITPSQTLVKQGDSLYIIVNVENQGGFIETFDVTTYCGSAAIGTQTVTNLAPGNHAPLTFTWNTTGVALGNYFLSAYATQVPGETDIADNSFVDGVVAIFTTDWYEYSSKNTGQGLVEVICFYEDNVTLQYLGQEEYHDGLQVYDTYDRSEWNPEYAEPVSHKETENTVKEDGWFYIYERLIPIQPTSIEWTSIYGGTGWDIATSVVGTSDGGYAIAGQTNSFGAGSYDFWLVKTDSVGNMVWNKTYGGTGWDFANSVVETSDGGYAIAGYTGSFGNYDFWLVKTDSYGDVEWSQTYGGERDDSASSMVRTLDGGYAIAGRTNSFGAGSYDFWLVKTDSFGVMQWNRTYGGRSLEGAYSVVETSDGGYAIAGYTISYGAGLEDFWLVKTDSAGNVKWTRTYGGTDFDVATSVVGTSDGGYAIAGYTMSFGAGNCDFWLVKTDPAGAMQWNQTYGGPNYDYGFSMVQTSDGGYAIAGSGFANLVKTDANGNQQWSGIYGGTAHSVVETVDGGYALAGTKDGDFWLVKLGPPSPTEVTQELIDTIETWNLPEGTESSLSGKLEDTLRLLEMGNENGAIHKLMDFINQVESSRENTLTNEQADYLIAEAQRIIDLIKG